MGSAAVNHLTRSRVPVGLGTFGWLSAQLYAIQMSATTTTLATSMTTAPRNDGSVYSPR